MVKKMEVNMGFFFTKPATNLLITLYEENEEELENPREKCGERLLKN